MPTLRTLSDDEARDIGLPKYSTYSPQETHHRMSNAYMGQTGITRQQGIDTFNLAKTVGIEPVVPVDKEQQDQANVNSAMQQWAATDWLSVATELPATASILTNPIKLSAVKPNVGLMGFFEHRLQSWNNAGVFNRLDDKKRDATLRAMDNLGNRDWYTGQMQAMGKAQEKYMPDGLDMPFGFRQFSHYMGGLAKSSAKGIAAMTALNALTTVPTEAGIGAAALGPVGAGIGTLTGLGTAFVAAIPSGIQLGVGLYNFNMMRAMSYEDQIAKGSPANQDSVNIANATGLVVSVVQQRLLPIAAKFGIQSMSSLIPKSAIPSIVSLGKVVPAFSHVADEIAGNPSQYIGRPLLGAVTTATKNLIKSYSYTAVDLFAQNLAINLASNISLIESNNEDKILPMGDIVKNSASGIGSALWGMTPFMLTMSIGSGLGMSRAIRDSQIQSETLRQVLDASKKNDNHSVVPDLDAAFHGEVGKQTGITHIGIDLTDARATLEARGLIIDDVLAKAGLGKVYQTAMENGEQFVKVPIEEFNKIAKTPIEGNEVLADLVQGSMRLSDDVLTENQAKEVQRMVQEEKAKTEPEITPDDKIIHDEIAQRINERLKAAHQAEGKSSVDVESLSKKDTKLYMDLLEMEYADGLQTWAELQEKYLPHMYGASHFVGSSKKAHESQVMAQLSAEGDSGFKIVSYDKPIYFDPKIDADLKQSSKKFSSANFTSDKSKGVPWQKVSQKLFGTSDKQEFKNKLDSAKFRSKKDVKAEIDTRVKELLKSDRFNYQPKLGEHLGETDLSVMPRVIKLFKGHDQSTFTHEMAHLFLQNKFEYIQSGREHTERYAIGWDLLKKALEITDDQKTLTEAQHEKFATGWERFVAEGVAPSIGLKSVFKAFQGWMNNLGKLVGLDNISPELRQYFEMSLATDSEIARVKSAMGYEFIAKKFESAGYDKRTIAYLNRLFQNGELETARLAMSKMKHEFDSTWQKARENFKKEQSDTKNPDSIASKMWNEDPFYFYVNELEKDARSNSKRKVSDENVNLNRDKVYNDLRGKAQEVLDGADSSKLIGMDIIMETTNPTDTAKAILMLREPTLEIESRVEQAAQEKYPILMKADDFQDQIVEMYHNNDTLTALYAQETAYRLKDDQGTIKENFAHIREKVKMIRESARQIVGDMPITEIKKATRTLITAERNSAILAERYFRSGNIEKATEAKHNQVMAHAKLSEAMNAQKFIEKSKGKLDLASNLNVKALKRQVHFDALVDLLSKFGITSRFDNRQTEGTMASWQDQYGGRVRQRPQVEQGQYIKFADWVESFGNPELNTVMIPKWLLDADLSRSINELKVGELRDLTDAIATIRNMANTENQFKLATTIFENGQYSRTCQTYAESHGLVIPENLLGSEGLNKEASFKSTYLDQPIQAFKTITLGISRMCKVFGANDSIVNNPFYQAFVEPFRKGTVKLMESKNLYFDELTQNISKLNWKKLTETYTDIGWKADGVNKVSLSDIAMMAHHMGTDSNFDRMVRAFNSESQGKVWTREYIENIVNEHMTNEMWDAVEANYKTVNKLWIPVKAKYEEVQGYAAEKIEGRTFKVLVKEVESYVEDGKTKQREVTRERYIEGDYIPINNDPRFIGQSAYDEVSTFETIDSFTNTAMSLFTKNGSQMERSIHANRMIDMSIEGLYKHVEMNLRDISYRAELINAYNLAKTQIFRDTWVAKHGEVGYRELQNYLVRIANDGKKTSVHEAFTNKLVAGTTVTHLMWNSNSAIADLVGGPSLLLGQMPLKRVGMAYLKLIPTGIDFLMYSAPEKFKIISNTASEFIKNPELSRNKFEKWFATDPWLKQRFETRSRERYDILHGEHAKEWSPFKKLVVFGIFEVANATAEVSIYEQVYNDAIASGFSKSDAISIARDKIATNFGSGKIEDRPEILTRTEPASRVFNIFSTFFFNQGANLYLAGQKFSQGNITQKINAISWMIGLTMVAPTLGLAGQRVLGTKKPKDDESEAQFWGSEMITNTLRMFPVTNIVSGYLGAKATGKPVFSKSNLPLAFKPLEGLGDSIGELISDNEISDKLESLSTTGLYWWNMTPWGRAVPIPLQANKVLWNFHDILTGKIQPEVRDLVTRRPESERE